MQNKPIHLLLADDDEDDRLFFVDAAGEIDIPNTIQTVKDGHELMLLLNQEGITLPDLLFLDLNMPRKSGLQCLIEIRTTPHLKDIPIAIYSTSCSVQDFERTYVNGADIYLVKPNSFAKLRTLLAQVIKLNLHSTNTPLGKDEFVVK